jgi:hypothetical protein
MTVIPIALSLFHMFNNHCSQQSTQSLFPAVFISDCSILERSTATVGIHSLHSTITLCNHTMLLWPVTVDSLNNSRLHCLNYTDWLPYWHYWLAPLRSLKYNHSWLTALRWFQCWHSYAHWLTNWLVLLTTQIHSLWCIVGTTLPTDSWLTLAILSLDLTRIWLTLRLTAFSLVGSLI